MHFLGAHWFQCSNQTHVCVFRANDNIIKTHSEDESISGKSYKKKLQEELFAESNGDFKREEQLKPKERKRKFTEGQTNSDHLSPKKKKIKKEPESDIEVSENKINGHNHSVSQDSYHETYLDIKVKAEQEFATPSLGKTKKNRSKSKIDSDNLHNELLEAEKKTLSKNKNNSCEDTDIDDSKLNQLAQDENENHNKRKKKKKSAKTRKDSLMSDETRHQYSDMEVSETIIEASVCGSPTYSEANVTSHLDSVEPDIKTNNNTFISEDPENSRNGETPRGKHQLDLPFNKSVTFSVHEAAATRTSRISERIQFEEDDSSEMETSQLQNTRTSINSSKLKTYLKSNLNLKPFSCTLEPESVLTADDEIWIVRCPKDVDIDAFQNKDISLEGKCKLKLNGQTYEGIVDNEGGNKYMSILSSDQSDFIIKSLPLKGFLNLRKRIPKCHMRDEVMVSKPPDFIPLPETKCRHPFFGLNYRKGIKLPAAVAERLRASPAIAPSASGGHLKASRKRRHNVDNSLSTPKLEPNQELSVKLDVENHEPVSWKKPKKKKKHLESEEMAPKTKRRLKHNLESAEAWESEQAIEENLFNF